MLRRTVALDRDGTIVVDRGYLSDPDQLEFCPGAEAGLQRLSRLGCRLIVVTNQSGVGRGYLDLQQLDRIHHKLQAMIAGLGVVLEGIYVCPHDPGDQCACRKPGTGLMEQAARDLDFNPATAVVVGDKKSDVDLGKRLGATTILISAGKPLTNADFVAANLLEAAAFVETFCS
jgi:D-glycero-D-manno-heptose 1,7-bisphosphate phosphatase